MSDNSEDLKRFLAEEEEIRKLVFVKDDRIIVNVVYDYEILLNRCDSYEKILFWAMQLSEKTWMTTKVLNRFIGLALAAHNLKRPQA